MKHPDNHLVITELFSFALHNRLWDDTLGH